MMQIYNASGKSSDVLEKMLEVAVKAKDIDALFRWYSLRTELLSAQNDIDLVLIRLLPPDKLKTFGDYCHVKSFFDSITDEDAVTRPIFKRYVDLSRASFLS